MCSINFIANQLMRWGFICRESVKLRAGGAHAMRTCSTGIGDKLAIMTKFIEQSI